MNLGIFQVIITLVGFVFVAYQLFLLRRSIRSSTYQNVYQMMINIDNFFIENPDLKPYFYEGQIMEEREGLNYTKLLSVAEMLIDYFDNVYHQKDCMPRRTFEGFSEFMKDMYRSSPVLQEFLSQRKHWYPQKFIEYLKGYS